MSGRTSLRSAHDLSFGPEPWSAVAGRGAQAPHEWYDATWNPTAGCSAISPGCAQCGALRTVAQLARMGGKAGARYAELTHTGRAGATWTGEVRLRADLLTWPLIQRKPRRILVDQLSDLFHEKLAITAIDALHAVMAIAHWHRFLILTKRAERMRAYYTDPATPQRIAMAIETLSSTVLLRPEARSSPAPGRPGEPIAAGPARPRAADLRLRRLWAAGLARIAYRAPGPGAEDPGAAGLGAEGRGESGTRAAGLDPWPLPNLWPGVSVEDQKRIGRIRDLVQMPAALRWVCFEPLLGPVRPDAVPDGDGYFDALGGGRYVLDSRGGVLARAGAAWPSLDWAVAGGETGPAARPTNPDWVRGLRDRCTAAGVPFFFKQWGEWAPASEDRASEDRASEDRAGRRMVRLGRRAAGRLLDGQSWNGIPPAMRMA